MTPDIDLDELTALIEAADLPSPIEMEYRFSAELMCDVGTMIVGKGVEARIHTVQTALLIEAALNNLPALLSALTATRAELEQTKAAAVELEPLSARAEADKLRAVVEAARKVAAGITETFPHIRDAQPAWFHPGTIELVRAVDALAAAAPRPICGDATFGEVCAKPAGHVEAGDNWHERADQLTAAPKPDEPLYVDFSWSGNGAEQTAELSAEPDRPLFRLDAERMREFVGMAADTLDHLDECRLAKAAGAGDGEQDTPKPLITNSRPPRNPADDTHSLVGDGEQDTATCGHPAIWLRQPGNRPILCTLPAGHDGDHQEPATQSHWSHNGEHGNVQTGDPRLLRAPASVQGAADGEAQA